MTATHSFAAWLRHLGGFVALAGVFLMSGCGGGSGAPNNQFAAPPPVIPTLTITPNAITVYSQVAATLTITGGVAPYRAFSSNPAVLPVAQAVPGSTVTLLAAATGSSTFANITVQDSSGASAQAVVTIVPGPVTPPPPLVVLPTAIDAYSTIATQLTVSGGVPPYRAFSTNSAVLPVAQNVSGSTVNLLATTITLDTLVTVTVQDSVSQTASVTATVHPKPVVTPPPLVVLPSSVVTSKGLPVTLTISGGLAPFKAYSSNPAVIPVNQSVTGNSFTFVSAAVADATDVAITVQDSAGQTATVGVTVQPDPSTPPPTLTALPDTVVIFANVPTSIFVTGGVPPYRAFSSNPTVLPVTQAVGGSAVPLLATNVSVDTFVTLTIQDTAGKTATSSITVRPASIFNAVTIKPNIATCGSQAICSGQTGTATVALQLPGGGPASGRQVRFDVISGPFTIAANGSAPAAQSVTVTSDVAGNAQVIIKANVDAPTQPAQIRATDLASGQQVTGDFLIQQVTDGSTILTVVPPEATFTDAYIGECTFGFRADYFIYGGTPPYRITQTFPDGSVLLNPTVNASGGFFEIVSNGACVNPQTFSIVDATGRQTTAKFFNLPGTQTRPVVVAPALDVVPDNQSITCAPGTIVDFVISGGTPKYNASASPRNGTSPTITARDNPNSGNFSTTPVVNQSGGVFRVSNLTQSVTVSFVDSSSPQKTLNRTITCAGTLTVFPAIVSYTGTTPPGTCVNKITNFSITGGQPPYSVAFTNPSLGTITPTTVPTSGGGFTVTGLQNQPTGPGQTFVTITDNSGATTRAEIDCP